MIKNSYKPYRLTDLCLYNIIRNFRKFTSNIFQQLPDELSLKIMNLLNKRRKLNDSTILLFLHSDLRSLDLTNCYNVNITNIISKCSNLQYLCLSGCLTVSDNTLIYIANHCLQLRTLILTYNKKITDESIIVLSKLCTNIQVIELNNDLLFHVNRNLT